MDWTNLTEITVSNVEDTNIDTASAEEITLNFKNEFNRKNSTLDLSTLARKWVYTDISERFEDEEEFIQHIIEKSTTDKLYSKLPDRVFDQFTHFFQLEVSELT